MPYRKCVLALCLLVSACSRLHETSALDRLMPCRYSDGPTDGYCGTLAVWENRDAASGRKIPLKIVLLPALKQPSAPDPLFILAGGPGQGAAELAGDLQEPFRRIQTVRDIVFVDQRGTGKSNPLDCKPVQGGEDDGSAAPLLHRLPDCLESYRDKADVTQYTTPIAMDDLDDVRRFLGYSQIDLYGGSYGTRAAIVYARRHPDSTRAVILDGAVPTGMLLPLFMARDGQRALDLLLRDCAQDAACAHRFPNLRDRFTALLTRLDAHPRHIRYVHPRTGTERELDIKRLTVAGILYASLYSPVEASLVPLLIEQAEKGNFTGFLALASAHESLLDNMSIGMQFSVLCSEDASRIAPGDIERQSAGTLLGEIAAWRLEPCAYWPRAPMDPAYFDNSPSAVPALILSGQLDPVTPPAWGEQVASQWKNARHIVVPATGHGAAASGCVMKLMAQFLDQGGAASLDVRCVDRLRRPPFFLGPSGPNPIEEIAQ